MEALRILIESTAIMLPIVSHQLYVDLLPYTIELYNDKNDYNNIRKY